LITYSCIRKKQGDTQFYETDIVYTDNFSPNDWENPVLRKQIVGGDKDIGVFVKDDTIDPSVRNISITIEKFFATLKSQKTSKNDDIKSLLTLSSYNSYLLRYQELTFDKDYKLRVAMSENREGNPFWVNFKIIFKDKSLIGKIELLQENDDYKISDFDEYFFNDLKKYIIEE